MDEVVEDWKGASHCWVVERGSNDLGNQTLVKLLPVFQKALLSFLSIRKSICLERGVLRISFLPSTLATGKLRDLYHLAEWSLEPQCMVQIPLPSQVLNKCGHFSSQTPIKRW